MMQQELFESSWPLVYHDMNNNSCWNNNNQVEEYCMEFDDHQSLQVLPMMEDFPMELLEQVFEPQLSGEFEAIYGSLMEDESVGSLQYSSPSSSTSSSSSSPSIVDVTSVQPVLFLPEQDMKIENELGLFHLLKACGEAIEKEQSELKDVILRRIGDRVSPVGKALERVGFILSQQIDTKFIDYLIQESLKNSNPAFKAFCQIFPYVKFAQFTANSAILEATPDDVDTLHIVDFDMREGLQWSQAIEAASSRWKSLKLTSIRLAKEEEEVDFEQTKRQLLDHASSYGLELKIQQIGIEDLVSEVKKGKKRGCGKEFLAFNIAVGMSHMRITRSRKLVMEFLNLAKDLLSSNKALLDSIESTFPAHLSEARMTMETLFVAPFVSSSVWSQKWEEIREGFHLKAEFGLKEWRLSNESLMEAKEMVSDNNCYEIRSEGVNGNEASLNWKGVPLVRISAWTN
ncbi:protein NODULATION SIGNALING PATHWAY 2 [Cannabis sativa]|uniref:protein NODULATION SIGNALING PATHWAY 2 n=1 Tax=Cannabis sativa TaxID=3483 RepID=UPI0011DFA78E|nr:protein NODULATION SIGNALING PATHWAY 2 [Cannabis sativa]